MKRSAVSKAKCR